MSEVIIPGAAVRAMYAHAYMCYPMEMCGLLLGSSTDGRIERFVPMRNVAESAKLYTLDPKEHLKVELAAEAEGLDVVGVAHSHTHSEAYPSPTDVAQAPDPGWHYVIVTMKDPAPAARSFRIVGDHISEEIIRPA
jgi:proteasome lid subunit RPN8/RPN11